MPQRVSFFLAGLACAVTAVMAYLIEAHPIWATDGAAVQPGVYSLEPQSEWPVELAPWLLVHEDPGGKKDLQDVLALEDGVQESWQPFAELPVAQRSRSTWWIRLKIVNPTSRAQALRFSFDTSGFGQLDWFLQQNGHWATHRAGRAVPLPINADSTLRRLAFPLYVEPGEAVNIVARIRSDVRMKVAPRLYSEQAFHVNNGTVSIVDGLLIGGLFALTLSAFFLALYSRRREFVLLGLTTLTMVLHEASSRGYSQIYLWPDAYAWNERASLVLAAISCSLFLCFAMSIVRAIDIKWPCKRYFQGLVLAPIPVTIIAIWGDSVLAGQLLTLAVVTYGFSLSLAALALLCLNRPGGNSLLLVALYFIFQVILRYASAPGLLPRWINALTMNDNINNSVLGLIAFTVNLAILMAWVVMIGRQRVQAQAELVLLQEKEKEHLAQEVERQTAALHKALRYADEKNRQKTETLGFISHDLRAPLATIVGYTRLLETNARPDQKFHIRAIEHGASYQMALIDDLMEYSHNELQPLSLAPAPLLLVNLLDDRRPGPGSFYCSAYCAKHGRGYDRQERPQQRQRVRIHGTCEKSE